MEKEMRTFLILVVCFLMLHGCAHAYTLDQLVTAIGKAENSKTHPYGIMVKYRHTTPKQACLNTVKHKYRLWQYMRSTGYPEAFLPYLASVYAPLNASNDPYGLNRNWLKNVTYFLKES